MTAPNSLTTLAQHLFGERSDYLALWSGFRKPGVKKLLYPAESYFCYPDQLDQAEQWASEQARINREVYFCTHLLLDRQRIKENAAPVLALWCDVDTADLSQSPIEPTMLVESSPGRYQAYARLTRPIQATQAEELNKRWALAFGADVSGYDLTQLLRVPGTFNHKYPDRPQVRLVGSEGAL